jgi:hypothetical protein
MIGLINMKSSPREIAKQAIADAAYMCTRTHGDAPEVTIHGRTDLYFPYVSSHISYMLLELLKNSMRATVECHGIDNMPPIRIVIADGEANEDVSDKISLPPPYSLTYCVHISLNLLQGGHQSVGRGRRHSTVESRAHMELSLHYRGPECFR